MKKLALIAGLALAPAVPTTALACSPIPNYQPPTPAELEQRVRDSVRNARAVVEVVAETGSVYPRPGRMRVLRSYKGYYRPGQRIPVASVPGPQCGHGDFPAGLRGIMLVYGGGRHIWTGFIAPAHVAMLRREGLLPPR